MYDAQEVLRRLAAFYGPREWYARNEPLKELIQTVLAQHTSDLNAERSFGLLWQDFGSWKAIGAAPVEAIAESIRTGGLAQQKAPRIKAILQEIHARRGDYSLGFLRDLPFGEALQWLTSLHGVGPKTARCVLLFALGFPCIPVDTHVHRVARRLGLIGPKTTADQAHGILEGMVAPQDAYRFHVYLIEHGRRICKAPRPRCPECPLNQGCPSSTAVAAEAATVYDHGR
ncbi:MAG: endonuclease III [Chloroflexi bacterium]|nr:endonuclease III [Chloroflexota bacterium]